MLFRSSGGENDERFQALIRMGSTAFWDAYLRTDAGARRWLAAGGFERAVGDAGVLEKKLER